MAESGGRIIAVCQLGGEFDSDKDGSLSYRGGDAHAIDVDDQTSFNSFKAEVAEMFNCEFSSVSLKYFLPGNRKTLILVSNDKDLQRMIKFPRNSPTTDVFVILEHPDDASVLPDCRSSRTTLSEAVPPVGAPLPVFDDFVDDTEQPDLFLAEPLDFHLDDAQIVSLPVAGSQV